MRLHLSTPGERPPADAPRHPGTASTPLIPRTDVVVIGGSLAGLTTALLLAQEGVKVQLFEATTFDQPHGLGGIELNVVEHPHRTARALGDRIGELWEFTDRNKAEAEALGVFDRAGVTWHGTSPGEPEALEQSACILQEHGRRAELVGQNLVLPDDGMLRTHGRQHLISACRAAGAVLHEGCEVRLDQDQEAVWINAQRVQTELTVLAAGWGCAALDARLGRVLTPVRDVAVWGSAGTSVGFHRAGQGWVSWRDEGGFKALSGARWATPHLEVGETLPKPDARVVAKLEQQLGHPRTGARAWIGCSTLDQLPLIGPLPGQPRRLVATGFATNPATWSFVAARSLVEGILRDPEPLSDLVSTRRMVRWRFG